MLNDVKKYAGRLPLLMLVLVWLGLMAGDWVMRFRHFRWHETVLLSDSFKEGGVQPQDVVSIDIPDRRGGDLTNLLGIPGLVDLFAELHRGGRMCMDSGGYRNPVYPAETRFDVVVVGDSYLIEGGSVEDLFASRLSSYLGVPVLNRAFAGRGPFLSLIAWLEEVDRGRPLPRVVVWGFVEREMNRTTAAGMVYQVKRWRDRRETPGSDDTAPLKAARVNWSALRPDQLKTDLPGTSALAQMSRKFWIRLRYALFRQINSEVIWMRDPEGHRADMLGYRIAVDALRQTAEERDVPWITATVEYLNDMLKEHGVKLVVMPVPDKEAIYADWISQEVWGGAVPGTSIIPELKNRLRARDIAVVNLFDLFVLARTQGVPLYWRDDTHWRPEAVALAAKRVAEHLQNTAIDDAWLDGHGRNTDINQDGIP